MGFWGSISPQFSSHVPAIKPFSAQTPMFQYCLTSLCVRPRNLCSVILIVLLSKSEKSIENGDKSYSRCFWNKYIASSMYPFILFTPIWNDTPILWPPDAKSWLIGKDSDAGKDWRWEEKGMTEEEVVGWHHQLNGHEFEQTPGGGEG